MGRITLFALTTGYAASVTVLVWSAVSGGAVGYVPLVAVVSLFTARNIRILIDFGEGWHA